MVRETEMVRKIVIDKYVDMEIIYKSSSTQKVKFVEEKTTAKINIHRSLRSENLARQPRQSDLAHAHLEVCASKQCPDWSEHGASSGPLLAT
jgi:hypothetical protein